MYKEQNIRKSFFEKRFNVQLVFSEYYARARKSKYEKTKYETKVG